MTDSRDLRKRATEVVVFAPIGLASYALEMAPDFIDSAVRRGQAEFDRRQAEVAEHINSARSLGQVAIAFGLPKLRKRVEARITELMSRAETAPAASPHPAPVVAVVPDAPRPRPVIVPVADAPPSETLPIPGYDALSASQVVERLTGLCREDLDRVHAYESAHRRRRTILGKIEQLAG